MIFLFLIFLSCSKDLNNVDEKLDRERVEKIMLFDNPEEDSPEELWNMNFKSRDLQKLWMEALKPRAKNIGLDRVKSLISMDKEYVKKAKILEITLLEACLTLNDTKSDKTYLKGLVELLIPYTNSFFSRNDYDSTIFEKAIDLELGEGTLLSFVKRMIEVDSKVNGKMQKRVLDTFTTRNIPLTIALERSLSSEILELLIDNTSNWNKRGIFKSSHEKLTAFDLALELKVDDNLIRRMVDRMSNCQFGDETAIDLRDDLGYTALVKVIKRHKDKEWLIDLLIEKTTNFDHIFIAELIRKLLTIAIKEEINPQLIIKIMERSDISQFRSKQEINLALKMVLKDFCNRWDLAEQLVKAIENLKVTDIDESLLLLAILTDIELEFEYIKSEKSSLKLENVINNKRRDNTIKTMQILDEIMNRKLSKDLIEMYKEKTLITLLDTLVWKTIDMNYELKKVTGFESQESRDNFRKSYIQSREDLILSLLDGIDQFKVEEGDIISNGIDLGLNDNILESILTKYTVEYLINNRYGIEMGLKDSGRENLIEKIETLVKDDNNNED